MRTREMWFAPWQAADYTGLKVEAIYDLLASGEIAMFLLQPTRTRWVGKPRRVVSMNCDSALRPPAMS